MTFGPSTLSRIVGFDSIAFYPPFVFLLAAVVILGVGLAARAGDWRPRWTWLGALWPLGCASAVAAWGAAHPWREATARPAGELASLEQVLLALDLANVVGCLVFLFLLRGQRGVGLLLLAPGIVWSADATLVAAMNMTNIWL